MDPYTATTTTAVQLEAFLSSTFNAAVNNVLYMFGEIWPYLITIGVIVVFWRVGRAFFR